MQNRLPARVVIFPKDVENITGRKYSTACALLQKIRKALGKEKDQFITVQEFCLFTGIDEELVKEFVN